MIENYFTKWKGNLDNYLSGYLYDETGKINSPRFSFYKMRDYVFDFLEGNFNEKIILLPGMRGVGKTTILAQLYFLEKYLTGDAKEKSLKNLKHKIYITGDDLIYNNFELKDFFEYYEKSIGASLETAREKILILIDEIHFDPKWGLFLKTLFDKTKKHNNILVIATGSSALLLQSNHDLTRRKITEKIYPLSFIEYLKLKHNIVLDEKITNRTRRAIFYSKNANEVFKNLSKEEKTVSAYWGKIPDSELEMEKYFRGGTFPFNLKTDNEAIIFDKINSILSKIIDEDVLKIKKFDSPTILKMPNLLYILGASEQINLSKISSSLPLNINTLREILSAFSQAEILLKLPSYGTAHSQARKELKYLFLSPSIRISILKGIMPTGLSGAKLEDYSAQIFYRDFLQTNEANIFYDSSKNGADFIFKFFDMRKIIIETGFNKETVDQIYSTYKKVTSDYGVIAGSKNLELVDNFVVKIPLKYWMIL